MWASHLSYFALTRSMRCGTDHSSVSLGAVLCYLGTCGFRVESVSLLRSAEQSPWQVIVITFLGLVSMYVEWGPPHRVLVKTDEM